MDEADETERDEAEAFVARRQARRKLVVRLFAGAAGVAVVFVGFQGWLQRELRHDAAARGVEALHAYVVVLEETSPASLASTLQQRFWAASVSRREPDLSEARQACRDLRDALYDVPDEGLFYEAPDLGPCSLLVDALSQCGALSASAPSAVQRQLDAVQGCAEVLVGLGDDLTAPELDRTGIATPPSPLSLPDLPAGDELYGRPVWFPNPSGVVAVLWLRNEERCTSTPELEALDCIRPATFDVTRDRVSELVVFPLPEGFRAWHSATVDEHGTFVALARGPGKQQLVTREPSQAPQRVDLRWDEDPLRPEELADPAWAAAAWQARDRKAPLMVGAAWSSTPEVGRTAAELDDGSIVTVHDVGSDRLIFARRAPEGPPHYRELVPADAGDIQQPELTATPDGALVVSWTLGDKIQFIWSSDAGRTWHPEDSPPRPPTG